MTLFGAILKKVQSHDAIKYPSPPPELEAIASKKKKLRVDKFASVRCAVDTRPPRLAARVRCPPPGAAHACALQLENMRLLLAIKRMHFTGGRVDCWWGHPPPGSKAYLAARVSFLARVQRVNRALLHIINTTGPRLTPTSELERDWARARSEIRRRARGACPLLPPPSPPDPVFAPPPGVTRPRLSLSLGFRGGARLGELPLELFADVCPRTCDLFLELLRGDGLGHSYVGTCFYRWLQEELLLVERRLPEAGALWDLGAVRAPQPASIAAATAALPPPQNAVRQPNLQSLLSTNELSYELRKILISLVEAGARLAAAGGSYETALAQLSAALDEPSRGPQPVIQVITPEDIAARLQADEAPDAPPESDTGTDSDEPFRRAVHLQRFLEKFRAWRAKLAEAPTPEAVSALHELGFAAPEATRALRVTGCNVPAAASWLVGERGSSVFELVNGLPDGLILQTLLKQPQIQRGLLNTRMLTAFIAMVGQSGSAALWLNSPHGSPLLSQISRTYHSEKYCLAVNQFSESRRAPAAPAPSTSRQR